MTRVVLLKPNSYEISTGSIASVDLSEYSDPDYISIACPSLSEDIDFAKSYFELTSNRLGEFTSDIASVALSSCLEFNELDLGEDCELRFPISAFQGADLSNITAIRFRIKALDQIVFKVMAIRAISADWSFAPVDMDTVSQCIYSTVSPNGNPNYEYDSEWPLVWQEISPKDFSVSSEIFTGESEESSSFAIAFRGGNVNEGIVNDLEDWQGTGLPATMEDLNQIRPELDLADSESEAFEALTAALSWSDTASSLTIFKREEPIYEFENLGLQKNTSYMAVFLSNGETFRVQIYTLDSDLGGLKDKVFDSSLLENYLFSARKGYFGWNADFANGTSFVKNVRHRYANFGDLTTRQFRSITPVTGVQLSHTSTPPENIVESFGSGPFGGIVSSTDDPNVYRVESNRKMEGIQTGEFYISDWENTSLSFELFKPFGKHICYLLGSEGNIIELDIDRDTANEWEKFTFPFESRPDPTGKYRLVVLRVVADEATWFVRNVKAEVASVHWSARNQDDPWNMAPEEWMTFGNTTNTANSGIMFKEPGSAQVRATITKNDASVSEFYIVPRYAELGRLVIDKEPESLKHKVKIVADVTGTVVNFAAQIIYAEEDKRRPTNYFWIFNSANESFVGPTSRKDFGAAGRHHAFVQVTFNDGTVQSDYWRGTLSA